MIDGVPLYGTTRALGIYKKSKLAIFTLNANWCKIGTYSTKLPANTVGTIDQLMEDG